MTTSLTDNSPKNNTQNSTKKGFMWDRDNSRENNHPKSFNYKASNVKEPINTTKTASSVIEAIRRRIIPKRASN